MSFLSLPYPIISLTFIEILLSLQWDILISLPLLKYICLYLWYKQFDCLVEMILNLRHLWVQKYNLSNWNWIICKRNILNNFDDSHKVLFLLSFLVKKKQNWHEKLLTDNACYGLKIANKNALSYRFVLRCWRLNNLIMQNFFCSPLFISLIVFLRKRDYFCFNIILISFFHRFLYSSIYCLSFS